MSLSAASRHPVGQTIKTPLFLLYEWGRNSEERFLELDTRHITLVLPVCERLLLSYKLSHTVSSQNRANLLPPTHPKRSVVSCNMANLNLTWHPSTSREQTFVTCHPLLSFPRIDESFPFLHFHSHCPTFQRTSIYYLQLSALLSENSLAAAASFFSYPWHRTHRLSDPPSRSIFPSFLALFSLWNAWFSFCAIRARAQAWWIHVDTRHTHFGPRWGPNNAG